ncbi:MAG: carbohydrate ABC transporter permease [Clostridiales bacterium]|jgi:multiple sugar transport system permease protein|nr:carbohydrate ABC transporter permease [Clostridiales bacterium]
MSTLAKRRLYAALSHAIIIAFGVVMLYPILWLIISSLKPGTVIFSNPGLIPESVSLEHYVKGWAGVGRIHFSVFFINTFIVCAAVVAANIVSCSMAAYAFARLQFAMKALWFGVMMLSIMLPTHVTTIPRYVMFHSLGWVDSYLPLTIPKLLATDAFFVFLLVQFMRGIPKDLDESATLDGCGRVSIFFRVILPLSGPALVTTALFSFLWTWDDFFNQLLYLNTPAKYTIALGLRMFMDASGNSSWGPMLAMSVLSMTPCFLLFFSLQKYFVQGIATTGLKG